jgi:hypothetical protein
MTTVALGAAAFATALCFLAPRTTASSLSDTVINMFPKQVGEFAYADMKSARKFEWFPQLRDQILPSRFRQFEQFLAAAGVDPNTQVDELAWGELSLTNGVNQEIVGIALGSFDPSSAEQRFEQQKLPTVDIQSYHLYAFGTGTAPSDILFMFIDSNTAAFGHRSALEKLIDVRSGAAESLADNDKLYPLIQDVNGTGIIWAVLDHSYAHLAVRQLLPQASRVPQAETIIDRLQAMTISIDADSGIDARFAAVCNTPQDADVLSAALQAGLTYRLYQQGQSDSVLSAALQQVRIAPSGDQLDVEIPISQDQILSLIASRAFAVPM